MLANLPPGFTYVGPADRCTEEYIVSELKNQALFHDSDTYSANLRLELSTDSNARLFTLGLFTIDIDRVRVSDLKNMRKLLPRTEYKLLKNRRCAHLGRHRRRKQTASLI